MAEKKRYNLALPQDMFDALQAEADARSTSVVELLRQFIRLGLLATQPGTKIVLREGDRESVILLL